jgi:hypothetical protein
MINTKYLKYISEEKQDAIYKSMVRDIYSFYHGMKTNENETIICLNGCKYDMSKENLRIVKTNKILSSKLLLFI